MAPPNGSFTRTVVNYTDNFFFVCVGGGESNTGFDYDLKIKICQKFHDNCWKTSESLTLGSQQ